MFRTTNSFHRPRSQIEYSAGYFVAADSRTLRSRQDQHLPFPFQSSTIAQSLNCTKIIICLMICYSLFFVCGYAAMRMIFSVSLWGHGIAESQLFPIFYLGKKKNTALRVTAISSHTFQSINIHVENIHNMKCNFKTKYL